MKSVTGGPHVGGRAWGHHIWIVVLIVALLHLSGALVLKYGLSAWFPKRVSEITIELGGTVLRGDGGKGVQQAAPAAMPSPVKAKVTDDLARQRPDETLTRKPSAAANAVAESSAAAGVQAAPTIDADYKAAYLNNPKPPYPALAFQMRIEGTVRLKALVAPDGSCTEVLLAQSSGNAELDRSALTTVAQWKFTPAKSQGKDVAQWVSIPITFAIKRR